MDKYAKLVESAKWVWRVYYKRKALGMDTDFAMGEAWGLQRALEIVTGGTWHYDTDLEEMVCRMPEQ